MSDLIDRQAAIDAVKRLSLGETDATRLAMRIGDYLERLPSAQPKRGKWIKCGWAIKCSECDYDMPFTVRNFCPNCGAKMRGEQDG